MTVIATTLGETVSVTAFQSGLLLAAVLTGTTLALSPLPREEDVAPVLPPDPRSVREMTPHVPPVARAADRMPTAVSSPMRRPRCRRMGGAGGAVSAVA
uniref:Uncharacterized protein n=1 Tax=Janibacter limosus TaxID=53458 RepID=A0AC61U9D5_9MICO|nr:hypothetical protein [Janibacter limosus]